ncbi:hypothetical protein EBI_27482 [Enterocytozoon bieneusi H348]|nr:hypothetical protein EBI_27482 [Enterocytozoon bieneusi H348]|eukprot:XP_002649438.1 hypothetical protein EBI_27482 [Enterocytozoon bieneusi H348]
MLKNQFEYEKKLIKEHVNEILKHKNLDCLKNYKLYFLYHANLHSLIKQLQKKYYSTNIKLSELQTIDILYLCEKKNNFSKSMISLLKTKDDLFISALQFLSKKTIYNELYYWKPQRKITNIFTFIQHLIPNFCILYKIYLNRSFAIGLPYINILHFIKEKYSISEYEEVDSLLNDIFKFKNRYITYPNWVENTTVDLESKTWNLYDYFILPEGHYTISNVNQIFKVPRVKRITKDIKTEIIPKLSYIEFICNNKKYMMTLDEFNIRFNINYK